MKKKYAIFIKDKNGNTIKYLNKSFDSFEKAQKKLRQEIKSEYTYWDKKEIIKYVKNEFNIDLKEINLNDLKILLKLKYLNNLSKIDIINDDFIDFVEFYIDCVEYNSEGYFDIFNDLIIEKETFNKKDFDKFVDEEGSLWYIDYE